MKKKQYLILAIAAFIILAVSYLLFNIEGLERERKSFKSHQRIISLGPSLTEELYLLGVEDRLVGRTLYCPRPKGAKTKEIVGTVIKVNTEKIVSLEPDLILATPLTRDKAIEKLSNLGIEVVIFPTPKNFEEICGQFLELAKLVGKEEAAEEIVNDVKDKTTSIREKVKGLKKSTVFVQIGAKPLFTVTRDLFINDIIEFAGGINIAQGAKTGLYSREEVLRANPEVIVIATMGITGEQEKETWQKFKRLNAAKNNRIYIIDADKLCRPTPVRFVEALEEMVEIIEGGVE